MKRTIIAISLFSATAPAQAEGLEFINRIVAALSGPAIGEAHAKTKPYPQQRRQYDRVSPQRLEELKHRSWRQLYGDLKRDVKFGMHNGPGHNPGWLNWMNREFGVTPETYNFEFKGAKILPGNKLKCGFGDYTQVVDAWHSCVMPGR